MRRSVLAAAATLLFLLGWVSPAPAEDYAQVMAEHRAGREERLRSKTGWLTVAGLFWLEPGENRMGSDPELSVVLTADGVPAWAGTLVLENESVTLRPAPDAGIRVGDEPFRERALRTDNDEDTDVLSIGRLTFHIVRRGDRFGVRVKDPEHPNLKGFKGLDYFPLDAAYRVDAVLKPFDEPHEVEISTVIGSSASMLAPGVVEFELGGSTYSLQPLVGEPGGTTFWFIFKDGTSGKESYGFRYLYADLADGRVDLDFNRAYNPPCAFTAHATCPLPPRENRLEARIEAGERIYHD